MHGFQALLIIMVVVYAVGHVFRRLSLPVVFGELLGGVLVGPAILNIVDPQSEVIIILAELGIFFLMLHVGLENNPREFLKASKQSILIALGGVLVPFVLITGGLMLWGGMSVLTTLFVGTALCTTAIDITTRLLKDSGEGDTHRGNIVLTAALMSDVLALILFSTIVGIHESGTFDALQTIWMVGKIIMFFTVVIWLGLSTSAFLHKFMKRKGFTFALIVALVLGLLAEAIGLHIIIGAFLAGLFIREEILDEKVFNKIEDRVYGLSYSFLGPIFFTSLAFKLNFDAVDSYALVAFLVILAVIGKFIGSGGIAKLQGYTSKDALMIGLCMNCRGAVDLIMASVGLEKGILSQNVFSALVLVPFITTAITIFGMKFLISKENTKQNSEE